MVDLNRTEKFYPICIAPPEKHYDSYQDLVRDIKAYEHSRAYLYTEYPALQGDFGGFEQVKNSYGNGYLLLPIGLDYGFLYRGQSGYFQPCLPTLMRGELSETDLFVERVRLAEFELMLKRYKKIQLFENEKWYVDYIGLAQHYGLKTDVLDFTIDIKIAMFFAMCDYNAEKDCYLPKSEDKEYVGYLYAMPTVDKHVKGKKENLFYVFSDKIKPIGLQPFKRPGAQKGFSLHFDNRDDKISGYLYSFNFTKKDSLDIYNEYQQGRVLWCEDEIVTHTKLIKNTSVFSYEAVSLATRRWGPFRSVKKWVGLLKANGLKIVSRKQLPWFFDTKDCSDEEWFQIHKSVYTRKVYGEDGAVFCRDTNHIGEEIFTNLMYGALDAPDRYDSGCKFMVGEENGFPYYGIESDIEHAHLEPNKKDNKIYADWKKINPIPPTTRSFELPNSFKTKVVRKKWSDGINSLCN